MKIVVAMDSFKGSLASDEANRAVAAGLAGHEVVLLPLSDGGEGFLEPFRGGSFASRAATVGGPLGEPAEAEFLFSPAEGRAILESARCCGLGLVPEGRRDPLRASSAGLGELIRSALDLGAREIVVGLGGSATCDCGMGMAAALGVRFLDEAGAELPPCGANLARIRSVDPSGLDARLARVRVVAACDVVNPLCGPTGSALVYAPQKGADARAVALLESGARNLATLLHRALFADRSEEPGAGAAGGLGFALRAFLDAELVPGADLALRAVGLREALEGASLLITGEGRYDAQTRFGKAPARAAALARARSIPTLLLCGGCDEPPADEPLFRVRRATPEGTPLALAMESETARSNLERAASEAVAEFARGTF